MKRKILRISLTFITLIFVAIQLGVFKNTSFAPQIVTAAGGFEITYLGNPISGPIFDIHNLLPGDCFTRSVVAKNNGGSSTELNVKSINEVDSDNLSTQIEFKIKQGVTEIFSNTLTNFYNLNNLSLGTLAPNEEKTYEFSACFSSLAGNEFQNTKTEFDLVFSTKHGSTPNQIPSECKNLKIEKFIIGDSGNNHLTGSSKVDFIDGKEGNDHITGGSDEDCLVGGDGNDKIEGQSGVDFIFGGKGNDDLRGGSGGDYLDGGEGNDKLDGDSGIDKCINGETNHSCEL